MKKYVYNTVPRPRTLPELRNKILDSRRDITEEHVRKAFLQLPRRCRTVIAKEGKRFDEHHMVP